MQEVFIASDTSGATVAIGHLYETTAAAAAVVFESPPERLYLRSVSAFRFRAAHDRVVGCRVDYKWTEIRCCLKIHSRCDEVTEMSWMRMQIHGISLIYPLCQLSAISDLHYSSLLRRYKLFKKRK